MRVLVNALSVRNLSGLHVLAGHVRQLATWTEGTHQFLLLHDCEQAEWTRGFPANVEPTCTDKPLGAWSRRLHWEAFQLPRKLDQWNIDLVFTPAGTVLPRCRQPQASLAQNPWCMVPGIHQGVVQRLKAATQRHAYRQAWRRAALMVYNSRHMQDLYRRNAGGAMERASCIAYQAIDDDTHAAAQTLETQVKRQPDVILAVSAMAAWKGIETIVDSLATLLRQGCHARLRLVGPWPNPEYERRIREQIAARDLVPFVTITGQVSRDELHREYAAARVFCLMSHCESFGIPAIEAQAFGTPVVGSSTCAMPEIGGDGGEYCDPTDAPRVAELLGRLLEDPRHWQDRSDRARVNAARYRWEKVSRPLMAMFETEGHVS